MLIFQKIEKSCKTIDPTFDANFLEDDLKDYATSLNVEYLGLQRLFRQLLKIQALLYTGDTGIMKVTK